MVFLRRELRLGVGIVKFWVGSLLIHKERLPEFHRGQQPRSLCWTRVAHSTLAACI